MKIVCNIFVGNCSLLNGLTAKTRKDVKSTLALCKHPKSGEYCFILFKGKKQKGAKYTIKNNIKQVLTKFANNGKCKIKFKNPKQELYIISDPIQLKSFLRLFKRVVNNEVCDKELTNSSLLVTAVKPKNKPSVRLTILKQSYIPKRKIPKSLEELHINNVDTNGLNTYIFHLTRLKILDLSYNSIESIPCDINTLPNLKELYLSHNSLHKEKSWNWLGGNLRDTLNVLDLSQNGLEYVPREISKLEQLISLNLNKNFLKSLIPGIGRLKNLKILAASNNQLHTLPGNIKCLKLSSIDVSYNQFKDYDYDNSATSTGPLQVCSLKEYAARKIIAAGIPYPSGTLPVTINNYLDGANFCVCGTAVFDMYMKLVLKIQLGVIAEKFIRSVDDKMYVPVDTFFCSVACYKKVFPF